MSRQRAGPIALLISNMKNAPPPPLFLTPNPVSIHFFVYIQSLGTIEQGPSHST